MTSALRNHVERCFNKMKCSRRLATRYDKTAASYLGVVQIVAARLWVRSLSTCLGKQHAAAGTDSQSVIGLVKFDEQINFEKITAFATLSHPIALMNLPSVWRFT